MTDTYLRLILGTSADLPLYNVPPGTICSRIQKNGRPCRYPALFRDAPQFLCLKHASPAIKSTYEKHKQDKQKVDDIAYEKFATETRTRMKQFFESLSVYRKVPPPESVASYLLDEVQQGKCYICAMMFPSKKSTADVEDHCHLSGMTRGLLCYSCNALEGKSNTAIVKAYRMYAPANGWFLRYAGMYPQWRPEHPDPFPNRLKMKVDHSDIQSTLAEYKKIAQSAEPTPIPATCYRRFDFYSERPLLLPGERYLHPDEEHTNPWWPITSAGIPIPEHIKNRLDERYLKALYHVEPIDL